jgi:hypothetical protein
MSKAKFYYEIKAGELKLTNPELFKNYTASLKSKTGTIIVEPDKNRRTQGNGDISNITGQPSNQNGYYWAVVIPILCDYFGYFPDEMHHAIKTKFLRNGGTDELPRIGSTAKLSRVEFENLMEKIRCWAISDYGVNIPPPESRILM